MNIQTGIAVALAVIVIGVFFLYPQFFPFGSSTPDEGEVAGTTTESTATVTELQVLDQVVGTGREVKSGDQVTVNYVGMFTDGTVFDASANHGGPATFPIGVGQVIAGWDQGLIGMKEGGKRVLVIPASLGYGEAGRPGIPGNSTLVFEIELVTVTPAP